jgi:hypothetical protein
MYESANASMWNGDRKQNQKSTLEKEIKKYVITKVWGFPEEQEEDSLSDRLKAELKDYVETVTHFYWPLIETLKSVVNDEMFGELDWRTRENIWDHLKPLML